MEIIHKDNQIQLSQQKSITDLERKFKSHLNKLNLRKPPTTPAVEGERLGKSHQPKPGSEEEETMKSLPYRELVGGLLWITNSRPDIAYAVGSCCMHMQNPGLKHWKAALRVLAYLVHTAEYKLTYRKTKKFELIAFDEIKQALSQKRGFEVPKDGYMYQLMDAAYADDPDTRRSTTGQVTMLAGGAVSWNSKRQPTVALSTTEAEYMAACSAAQEVIYIRQLMLECGFEQKSPTIMYEDNQSALCLMKDATHHNRSKHIAVRHHFVRERVASGEIKVIWIPTKAQVADALTKPLGEKLFTAFTKVMLGIGF